MVYLVRHGETEWSKTGQHTGRTDLPLTPAGEENARELGKRLRVLQFDRVLTSPLTRARRTCELAGFGESAVVDDDLVEWNYGQFEGKRSQEILAAVPGWELFRDGCPGGESAADVSLRADRVVQRLRQAQAERILVFSSGHILRMIGVRWVGLNPLAGRSLLLSTASVSILGYNHNLNEPAIRLWNNTVSIH